MASGTSEERWFGMGFKQEMEYDKNGSRLLRHFRGGGRCSDLHLLRRLILLSLLLLLPWLFVRFESTLFSTFTSPFSIVHESTKPCICIYHSISHLPILINTKPIYPIPPSLTNPIRNNKNLPIRHPALHTSIQTPPNNPLNTKLSLKNILPVTLRSRPNKNLLLLLPCHRV